MGQDREHPPRRRRTDDVDLGAFGMSLELARTRGRDVQRAVEQNAPDQAPLVAESLDTLDFALEELGVAEEELRHQNEALLDARDTIEQERERYEELFQSAPDAYFVTDGMGMLRAINQSALALLRTTSTFAVGKPLVIFVADEDRRRLRGYLTALATGAQQEWLELRLRPRAGEPVPAELRVSARRDRAGRTIELRWIARDVTERKRAERYMASLNAELELRVVERTTELTAARRLADELLAQEREARLDATSAQARLSFLTSVGGLLLETLELESRRAVVPRLAVPALADLCVLVSDEGDGARRLIVVHDTPALQPLADALRQALADPSEEAFGVRRALHSGEITSATDQDGESVTRRERERTAELSALGARSYLTTPLSTRGRPAGALLLVVGERHQGHFPDSVLIRAYARRAALALENARLYHEVVEARAREANLSRLKSEFFALLSHEVRTPLQAISGYAEMLRMGARGPLTPEQRDDLARIVASHDHVLRIVDDVLAWARAERGRLEIAALPVPLDDVLTEAIDLVRPQLASRGMSCEFEPGDECPVVRADPDKLRQILVNLVGNAAKYTDAGGHVTIGCQADGDRVIVRVHDDGRGIPADKLEEIFLPFVQLAGGHGATGVGLGLAISRELARAMGGELRAEPATRGATFALTLSRWSSPTASGPDAAGALDR
jgi:PAS domain S-box-containing protein